MVDKGKAVLEEALGKLLGFQDGVSDVLDHLLTIESRNDLETYLNQLLGDLTPSILLFVDNVERFQRGEPIASSDDQLSTTRPPYKDLDNENVSASLLEKPTTQPQGKQQSSLPIRLSKQTPSAIPSQPNQKKQQGKSRVPPPKKKPTTIAKANANSSQEVGGDKKSMALASSSGNQPQQVVQEVQKTKPVRGKASRVCGCYGTYHQPLTNCLHCGRISCSEEGYDFCPFCGFLVEDVNDGQDHTDDPNWVQKERLLRFDREFARRTQIFDDQADYQGPTTWMTEDEKAQAEENQKRQAEALKRPKQVLNLVL